MDPSLTGISSFNLESSTAELNRQSLEASISKDIRLADLRLQRDIDSPSDSRVLGNTSFATNFPDLDDSIRIATQELDSVLNEPTGTNSTSNAYSIEIARTLPKVRTSSAPADILSDIFDSPEKVQSPRRSASAVMGSKSMSDMNKPIGNSRFSIRTKKTVTKEIPHKFKSAEDLLRSLGFHEKPPVKAVRRQSSLSTINDAPEFEDSIKVPDITGITSLVSNDIDPRLRHGIGHKIVESIPLSEDNQAILSSLRELQEKIQKLENKNLRYKSTVQALGSKLRTSGNEYEQRIRSLEFELEQKLLEKATGLASEEKKRIRTAIDTERQGYEKRQIILNEQIATLQQDVSFYQTRARRFEEERDDAVKALSEALERLNQIELGESQTNQVKSTARKAKAAKYTRNEEKDLSEEPGESDSESDVELNVDTVKKTRRENLVKKLKPKSLPAKKSTTRNPKPDTDLSSGEVTDTLELSETEEVPPTQSRRSSQKKKRTDSKVAKSVQESEPVNSRSTTNEHNPNICTVCSRRQFRESRGQKLPGQQWQETNNVEYARESGDVTPRPTMAPSEAVSSVLDQLEEEFGHLKADYQAEVRRYDEIDPVEGKHKRKAIADQLKVIVEKLENRADQIYALYDVLEANNATHAYRRGGRAGRTENYEFLWAPWVNHV
ncbi:centrosome microtubule-binding domain of Cep57-domain-containing protein [Lipomyces oligophaga]|uniref:centrosome microtubule-binding domain of Cep57-domain-containing protein n=1 Tax=Lipomyces oligophaga TaxID=45792 RepID=UPI0034CF02DB